MVVRLGRDRTVPCLHSYSWDSMSVAESVVSNSRYPATPGQRYLRCYSQSLSVDQSLDFRNQHRLSEPTTPCAFAGTPLPLVAQKTHPGRKHLGSAQPKRNSPRNCLWVGCLSRLRRSNCLGLAGNLTTFAIREQQHRSFPWLDDASCLVDWALHS